MSGAREGVRHWWVQRVTSVALIPLTVWFLFSLLALGEVDYTSVVSWLAHKWTAVLLALLIGLTAWHSHLGVQVVLEDYVKSGRAFWVVLSRLAHTFFAFVAIFAVLRMGFGLFA